MNTPRTRPCRYVRLLGARLVCVAPSPELRGNTSLIARCGVVLCAAMIAIIVGLSAAMLCGAL